MNMDMNGCSFSSYLLNSKINDFYLVISKFPKKAKILSKLFAKIVGHSYGKILLGYQKMFDSLNAGEDVFSTKKSIEKLINQESKVDIKVPFLKQKKARLCGLVALNHSGFMEQETQLYDKLLNDLGDREYKSSEDVFEDIKTSAKKDALNYSNLLQGGKRGSIISAH